MQSKTITLGLYQTNCYILNGSYKNESFVMVIDPGDHFSYIQESLPGKVTHIVLTHYHFDHIGALGELKKAYPNAKVYAGHNEVTTKKRVVSVAESALGPWFNRTRFSDASFEIVQPDFRLKDHDNLLGFEILETPGHTEGSICLLNRDKKVLYSGDTLFRGSYGRTDFEGGDFDSLMFSVKKIMALDSDISVFPGHGEVTSVGNEKILY